jgi:Tfp pilus assembly protein PilF
MEKLMNRSGFDLSSLKALLVGGLLFLLLGIGVYYNTFDHEFHLDSNRGLKENHAVRDLSNIPSYFKDPFTLTSNRANADYRPILQITYALNYAISEYNMWSWHLTQILLHVLNALFIVLLARKFLPYLIDNNNTKWQQAIPWIIGLLFLLHPTASGVVNYHWARSSLLTTTFALPCILLWTNGRVYWAGLFFALAMFTKVEAISILGVLLLWDIFMMNQSMNSSKGSSSNFIRDVIKCLNYKTLKRFSVILLITLVYFIIRNAVVPDFIAESRQDADVGPYHYMITQISAWWHYIGNWWAPVNLIADDLSFPVYRSVLEPTVILAICGWIMVVIFLIKLYRTRPAYLIISLMALAIISPTSSIAPLAEMVNEHRPYMPIGILSIIWLVPLLNLIGQWLLRSPLIKLMTVGGLVVVLLSFSFTTFQRNKAFTTWENYWSDVVTKAPSWRSHLNLGNSFMKKGDWGPAEFHLLKSVEYSNNFYALCSLGILNQSLGKSDRARQYYNKAVNVDIYNSIALEYRGAFLMTTKEYDLAFEDLINALPKAINIWPLYTKIAQAAAGKGDWKKALDYTLKANELDPEKTKGMIPKIATPFWDNPQQNNQGVSFFTELAKQWPGQWWIHRNWSLLAGLLGDKEVERSQEDISKSLKNQ